MEEGLQKITEAIQQPTGWEKAMAIAGIASAVVAVVAILMTRYSIKIQNKQNLFDKRIKVYTLLRKTLDNYARSKKMMFCGDSENDFLEGLIEQSTPLLYLMTGHRVVIANKHLFEKITNSNVEKIATEYIDDLDEAIIQLEPLFRNGKDIKYVKLFLVSYRDYLLTLLDYKLSVESDEDLRAVGDFYSFEKIYKKIEEAEKKLSNDKSIMNSLEDLIRLDKSFLEKFKKKGNQ